MMDEDFDNGEDFLELPSCVESLVSSAEQIELLAKDISGYYIKYLLCYGYVSEPTRLVDSLPDFASKTESSHSKRDAYKSRGTILSSMDLKLDKLINTKTLELMNSTVEFLPFLDDLNSFIERCFATIEATLKRSTYHLNKSMSKIQTKSLGEEEFQLPPGTRIHVIFIALMDLMYALVSLDMTLRFHTNVRTSLKTFKAVCQSIVDTPNNSNDNIDLDGVDEIPRTSIVELIEFINNIQVTLCNENKSIFLQCMEHIQHLNLVLSNDRSSKGFESLCQHFEEFLIFYAENLVDPPGFGSYSSTTINQTRTAQTLLIRLIDMNLIPSLYMNEISKRLFGLSSLFLVYSWTFRKKEKMLSKVFTQTLQKYEQCNLILLFGSNCYIFLDDFISKHSTPSAKVDSKVMKQLINRSEDGLRLNLDQELNRLTIKAANWLVTFKSETLKAVIDFNIELDSDSILNIIVIFEQGVELIEEINTTIKSIMTSHLHFDKPVTKNKLISLLRMVPLLKSVELSLTENRFFVNSLSIRIEQIVRITWRKLIESTRKRLMLLRYSDRKLDTASSLIVLSLCSKTEYLSIDRGRMIMSLCLSILISSFTQNEIVQLSRLMSFPNSRNFYERLYMSSDCGYLYSSIPTFSTYYNYSFEENPGLLDEINYFHLALNDIPNLFTSSVISTWSKVDLAWLDSKRSLFIQRLGDELLDQFKVEFLDKICQELEIELRLQTHRDLNLNDHNPFKRHLYNFKQIFSTHKKVQTFVIFSQVISFKYYIEQYLNKVCFNLTALVPSDWFTYDSMINLARHRYDLKLVNSQLPTQNLDQGLDLLDITRNLALFVSRYGYDLINQLFIEKCSNRLSTSSASSMISGGGASILSGNMITSSANQMLNVVQIKHVAESLQMHGYGLLNSSVNCTYQVMKPLINLISKQFSDDQLRAILTKEQQLIYSNRLLTQERSSRVDQNIKQQPSLNFEKANKMAKRFKMNVINVVENQNLNLPTGVDLDSMRQSITQLGNLLAFIRLLKSGALNCASKFVDYLPDRGDLSYLRLEKFANNEFQDYQPDSLQKAASNFDQCLADLEENFSSKTNYFGIIINLFTKLLTAENPGKYHSGSETTISLEDETTSSSSKQEDRISHLKLFYLAIPALTINFIDYIINCKDRVTSRSSTGRFGALLSDDGFSMGVAFLLTVLKQTQEFASLEWFKQVREKLELDKKAIEHKIVDSKNEESLKQTLNMTLRRLTKLQIEYDGLDYTLSGALLFFRSSTYTV